MEMCKYLVKPAIKTGVYRGFCSRPKHMGRHGNNTCPWCGVVLTKENCCSSTFIEGNDKCRECAVQMERERRGYKIANSQIPGAYHKFPCGCEGFLPSQRGDSNKFVVGSGRAKRAWWCRVSVILRQICNQSVEKGYKAVDLATPHSIIRKMMEEPNCERCCTLLKWELGSGKTPHLHHNHATGEICGFTHPHCNPWAIERELDKLKEENKQLKEKLKMSEGSHPHEQNNIRKYASSINTVSAEHAPADTPYPLEPNEHDTLVTPASNEVIRRRNARVRDNRKRWGVVNSPMGVEHRDGAEKK